MIVLGAGGFLGRALLRSVPALQPVTAVARTIPAEGVTSGAVRWVAADLLQPAALDGVLTEGEVVINAAHASTASDATNRQLLDNIIEACLRQRAARLVHCSTAVVAGTTTESRVTESVICQPATPYERTKLALEQQVLEAGGKGLGVAILRPTAILGPGGANLLKLARSLTAGNAVTNYLRACLFGSRPMHLVPVRNVALALLHVAGLGPRANGQIYQIAADEDPDNNFAAVEKILLTSLGLPPRRLPPIPVPTGVLRALLGLLGRSDTNIARIYDTQKLRATGFVPVDSVAAAVREFGASLHASTLK